MATIAMTGNDTISINNRVFVDFADANVVELTYPNDIATVKTGKNGNTIYGLNETGRQCEVKIKVIRASSDDKFLNGLLLNQQANFAGFPLMIGTFIKKVGDGQGNIASDTYVLSGGVFTKQIESTSNVEGEVEQSTTTYTMMFSNSPRSIS